jgi:hypothetical protein
MLFINGKSYIFAKETASSAPSWKYIAADTDAELAGAWTLWVDGNVRNIASTAFQWGYDNVLYLGGNPASSTDNVQKVYKWTTAGWNAVTQDAVLVSNMTASKLIPVTATSTYYYAILSGY